MTMSPPETKPAEERVAEPRRTEVTQTVRLAVTMTGGVSLAIWMGGVARELNLLSQASTWRGTMTDADPIPAATDADEAVRMLYLRLLDLLDVSASIDVLSGASAGGINAALLGYSRARGLDLGAVREMWIDIGSMETLLRDPTDADFPSLMYGDARMLAALQQKMRAIPTSHAAGAPGFDRPLWVPPRTTLFITTTLLDGEVSRFTDSYDTVVQDTDHRGLFTFTEDELAGGAVDALALAARSSSAFPGAFEPAFLPFTTPIPRSKNVLPHPAMADYTTITRSHWVADGGLLVNRPLGPLLQAVFDRPADREIRRVLLYVVPSAGSQPSQLSSPDSETFADPPALGTSLIKDLAAVLNQSIAADLRAIRDHNDALDAVSDVRLRLAELGSTRVEGLLTSRILADYRARAGNEIIRPVISALERLISTLPANGQPVGGLRMPSPWRSELTTPAETRADYRETALEAVTETWPTTPPGDYAALATFGRPAFDGAKAIVLSMLRNGYRLAVTDDSRRELSRAVTAAHCALVLEPGEWPRRPEPDDVVAEAVRQLPDGSLVEVARAAALRYVRELGETGTPPGADGLDTAWRNLARVVANNAGLLYGLCQNVPVAHNGMPLCARSLAGMRDAAAQTVSIYLNYLVDADQISVQRIATRLFSLHATQRALCPTAADIPQPLELIQVSADTRTLLDPARQTAASKLTGMQLHHFGAFFKPSWRANDWMWGRLDGAGWLVHMLLDPKRLASITATRGGPDPVEWLLTQLRDIAGPIPEKDLAAHGQPPNLLNEARIRRELSFLDDSTRELPASLPMTAMWVATAWQQWITVNELPVLATQIEKDSRDTPTNWTRRVHSHGASDPAGMAALLPGNPVPAETLSSQVGTRLMSRTVSKALATATAAVATEPRIPKPAKPALSSARTITLASYKILQRTDGRPVYQIIAGLVALILGVALAIQQSTVLGVTGTVLILAGALVLVFGVWGLRGQAIWAFLSAVAVLAVALLALPFSRHWLFSTDEKDPGFVARRAQSWVGWLDGAWWHPLLVLGVLGGLFGVFWFLGSRSVRARKA